MDGVYNARERLNAELSEAQNLLKETLVRAEDALHCDHVLVLCHLPIFFITLA